MNPLFGNFSSFGKTKYLKPAGVGQDWPGPIHKLMQATLLFDDLRPRSQHQVKGISQNYLAAEFPQFLGGHRLDGAIGPHRHKNRRLDIATRKTYFRSSCIPFFC